MLESLKRVAGRIAGRGRAVHGVSTEERALMLRIRGAKLTYLSERKLACLVSTAREIEAAGLPGVFMEAGCALGGSAILLASVKRADRPLFVYDVFGMIPPPTEEDPPEVHERYRTIVQGQSQGIGGDTYYGYQADLYEVVQSNLGAFGIDLPARAVTLVRGLVQDTLHPDGPVALAHVDVDWYDPVMTCLQRVFPRLVVGGSIVLDDYHDWGGCRKATDEFLRGATGEFRLDDSAGSMKITRIDTRH